MFCLFALASEHLTGKHTHHVGWSARLRQWGCHASQRFDGRGGETQRPGWCVGCVVDADAAEMRRHTHTHIRTHAKKEKRSASIHVDQTMVQTKKSHKTSPCLSPFITTCLPPPMLIHHDGGEATLEVSEHDCCLLMKKRRMGGWLVACSVSSMSKNARFPRFGH